MTTYTKAFFGQADNPHFDLEAAVEAYEWVLAHPDEAPFVVSKMLFDNTSPLMEYYSPQLEEITKGYVEERLAQATRGLSRSVSKSAKDALGIVEEISKALTREGKWDEKKRDRKGQFASLESRMNRAGRFYTERPQYGGGNNAIPSGSNAAVARDALAAMTDAPGFAEYVARTARAMPDMTEDFAGKWGRQMTDRGVNDQTWRRLQASSKLAYDMGGKYLPDNAQFALKVGEWAGQYAPQAEKVIGPTARRSAYRYRGVEKKPDPLFQRDIDTLRLSSKDGRTAHEALIFGSTSQHQRGRDASNGLIEDRQESRTITRMKELLPDASLYELNRKSGTIPPSQGIVIDRSGKVVTEAVGYGDDWYLPFNLKNLSRLKGGEYIRTRAYGGLTTEDIYVGMVSGARAVTVVSHSGTYTMEFNDDFRGARRYNDKAGRMHARYAQLLDAVKSGDVQMSDISPARSQELVDQASMLSGVDAADVEAVMNTPEYKSLRIRERKNPTLAVADRNAAAVDGINQFLLDNPTYRNFDDFSDRTGITDPLEAARELGAQREVTNAIATAERTNADNLNPLKLNGRGYGKALKALQQQFPYYIARAEYIPSGVNRQDLGYVKPKFIRPEGALTGYYDETIEGAGKLPADRTNYQNASVIGTPSAQLTDKDGKGFGGWDYIPESKRGTRSAEDEDGAGGSAPASTPSAPDAKAAPKVDVGSDDYEKYQRAQAVAALARHIRESNVYGVATGDNAGLEVLDEDKKRFSHVFLDDLGNLEDQYLSNPVYAKAVDNQLQEIRNKGYFDAPAELWTNVSTSGATKVVPMPEKPFDILRGIGKVTYDLPGVKPGQKEEQYTAVIEDVLRNPEMKSIGATEDDPGFMSASKSYDEVAPAIKERATYIMARDAEIQAYKKRERVSMPEGWSDQKVKSSARQLAILSQAFRQRDLARSSAEPPAPAAQEEEAPKADAPEAGVDEIARLQAAAAPHQEKIRSYIGMDDVAEEIDKLAAQAIIGKRRADAGYKNDTRPMHLVFTGEPGTGKTTVAEVIAPLYHDLGLTEKNQVVTLTKSEIIGPFNNQVEKHVREVMNKNKGGVIIIDEAYTLATDAEGRKAIEEMVPMLTKELSNTVVILAGYPGRMKEFMDVNEGLQRRFPKTIKFRNYTAAEMRQIADKMLADREYTATKPATKAAIDHAVEQLAAKPNNGNAGGVSNFINHARDAQEVRLMRVKEPTRAQLGELTADDIRYAMMAMDLDPTPRKAVRRKKAA